MDIVTLILISSIILVVGVLGNIGGFGGGVIIVPVLSVFFGFPLKDVIGTALLALIFPALIGFWRAQRRGEVNYKMGVLIEVPTIVGVTLGTYLSNLLDPITLQLIFGSVATSIATLMLVKTIRQMRGITGNSKLLEKLSKIPPNLCLEVNGERRKISIPFATGAGLFIGMLSGMLGIGGGWMKAPIMVIAFGLHPLAASGTALFMILMTSLTGGILHLFSNNWNPTVFLLMSINLSAGALVGDRLKSRLNATQISAVISFSLLVISVITLIDAV